MRSNEHAQKNARYPANRTRLFANKGGLYPARRQHGELWKLIYEPTIIGRCLKAHVPGRESTSHFLARNELQSADAPVRALQSSRKNAEQAARPRSFFPKLD